MNEIQKDYFQARWPARLDPDNFTASEYLIDVVKKILGLISYPFHLLGTTFVHPACYLYKETKELTALRKHLQYIGENVQFLSPDEQLLDGMFFPGKDPDRVILLRTGNAALYEHTIDDIAFLLVSGASVFTYNPTGTGRSEGWSSSPFTLALDCFSAFDFLTSPKAEKGKGITPENVLFYGMSLGGAEITLGAGLVHEEYPELHLPFISDRSFISTAKCMTAFLCDDKSNFNKTWESCISDVCYSLLGLEILNFLSAISFLLIIKPVSLISSESFYHYLLTLINWRIDVEKIIKQLPGEKGIISHPLDGIIFPSAKVASLFDENNLEKGVTLIKLEEKKSKLANNNNPRTSYHTRAFYEDEKTQVLDLIRKFLKIETTEAPDLDPDQVNVVTV